MHQVGKKVPYVYVRWVNNHSDDYDGLEHWVPEQKMLEKNPKIGQIVRIKWYGKFWSGILIDSKMLTKTEASSQRNAKGKTKKPQTQKKTKKVEQKSTKQDVGKILWIGSTPKKTPMVTAKNDKSPKDKKSTTLPEIQSPKKKTISRKKKECVTRSENPSPKDKISPKTKAKILSPRKKTSPKGPNFGAKRTSLSSPGKKTSPNRANYGEKRAGLSSPRNKTSPKGANYGEKRAGLSSPRNKTPEGANLGAKRTDRSSSGKKARETECRLPRPDLFSPRKIKSPKATSPRFHHNVSKSYQSSTNIKANSEEYDFTDSKCDESPNIMKSFTRISKMLYTPQTSPMTEEDNVFYNSNSPLHTSKTPIAAGEITARRSLFQGNHEATVTQSARHEKINKDIEDVINSRSFHEMGQAGPKLMARCLMKKLFSEEELASQYMRKNSDKYNQLDQEKLEIIKDAILTEFEIPPVLKNAVWNECRTSIIQMLKYCRKQKRQTSVPGNR